jgi:cobalt-zinc-cadmium efflux system membrane fusion protein
MEVTRKSGKSRFDDQRQAVVKLTLICSSLMAIALSGCQPEQKATDAPAPKIDGETIRFETNAPQLSSLNVEPAETRTNAITHLTGRLYWHDDATVRVFTPVAGRVVGVPAGLGSLVVAGAKLAEIDSPDFGQALANARTAAGNLAAAEKACERTKDLLEHGAAAQKDVEAAEAAEVAAQAERDRAYAVLANYGGSDKSTNSIYLLRSPLAGVVVERNINPGQEVRADAQLANVQPIYAPLFVVSDPARLWLQLDVPESELALLEPGQALRIFSRAFPDKVFEGLVDNIGAELDPATRTIKVRGVVTNPDKLLKAEMYVMADVVMNTIQTDKATVQIPAEAVFMQNNQYYVFVEQTSGQFQRQLVKIGAEQDGKVPIFDGIAAGQKVVTEGCLLLESLLESTDKS